MGKHGAVNGKYDYLLGNTNAQIYQPEDVDKMAELIVAYFKECDKNEKPYTMSGLANGLRISKETLCEYAKKQPFGNLIKEAKQIVEQQLEENALTGKGNSTFTIFNLKNNYGWKDTVDNSVSVSNIDNITPLIEMLKDKNE